MFVWLPPLAVLSERNANCFPGVDRLTCISFTLCSEPVAFFVLSANLGITFVEPFKSVEL